MDFPVKTEETQKGLRYKNGYGQGEERLQDYGTYLIDHEKGLVFIIIPVLKSSSWTLDSLCQDHLYGLLPFLPFLNEKKLARKRRLPTKDVQELVQLARDVVKKLNELVESKTISEEFYQGLRGYCITVASQLMKNHMDDLSAKRICGSTGFMAPHSYALMRPGFHA